jgi:phage-related protein
MKPVIFHRAARNEIRELSKAVRIDIGVLLRALQYGERLRMPALRPMPGLATGACELRVHDRAGQVRVFCLPGSVHGVLVLRAFRKQTATTPDQELRLGRRRLKEMRDALEEDG